MLYNPFKGPIMLPRAPDKKQKDAECYASVTDTYKPSCWPDGWNLDRETLTFALERAYHRPREEPTPPARFHTSDR